MQIENVEVKSFGRLKNLKLEFSRGINIVFGNNETGKTSLQSYIKGMLYGLKGGRMARDGSLPPAKRYKPWEGQEYSGSLEFSLDSGDAFKIERDFAGNRVRIYDSSFNDITNSFEMTKDRGPLFAEKHLGLNDVCFEKTVFIKQLESKIDEDGGKELLNRLVNVSQTGFEDVSLVRALEALREAQKNQIGTDKTSTRPLDKVIAKLEECRETRNRCMEKRNRALSLETNLAEEYETRRNLLDRKDLLLRAKGLLEKKKEIAWVSKKKSELKEVLDSIDNTEQERKTILRRVLEINAERKRLEKFSIYDADDIDGVNMTYSRIINLEDECKDLQLEKHKKVQGLSAYRNRLEELKAFGTLEDNSKEQVFTLSKELEHLKTEKEKNNLEVLEEKIKYSLSRDKFNSIKLAVSLILLIFSAFSWFYMPMAAYILVPILTGISIIMAIARDKSSKELKELLNIKKVAFVFSNGIVEEIEKKQKLLDEILRKAKVEGIEEFFRLKADYDSSLKQFKELEREIKSIEAALDSNIKKLAEIKDTLVEMLFNAGVIKNATEDIKEEHIIEFRNNVRMFSGLDPSEKYFVQRVDDLSSNLASLYSRASDISENNCIDAGEIKEIDEAYSAKLKFMELAFEAELKEYEELCSEKEFSVNGLENIKQKFVKDDAKELEEVIDASYSYCLNELNEVQLRVKEYETLLQNMDANDEDIQNIEIEIAELEARKNNLEDLSLSLKTAIDLLSETGNELQRDFAPLLNQKMSTIISRITKDKYKDLRADSKLTLKAVSSESGDVVNAAALSGGTVDQIYLALRLAMADMISSGGESLPIILDEVFAQYDDIRTRETMKYFKDMSKDRQLILFTCKSREVGIAREVFGENVNIIEL